MGKGFELLGLITINIIIAMTIGTTVLSGKQAQVINALSEENVRHFLEEVADISAGKKEGMDSYSMTEYFLQHINDSSLFKTTMEYDSSKVNLNDKDMELDRLAYISNIIQGQKALDNHESHTVIDYVEIQDDGKSAFAVTTSYESGVIPLDNGMGETIMTPVHSTSYCEQKINLSDERIIQMAGANCTTNLSF